MSRPKFWHGKHRHEQDQKKKGKPFVSKLSPNARRARRAQIVEHAKELAYAPAGFRNGYKQNVEKCWERALKELVDYTEAELDQEEAKGITKMTGVVKHAPDPDKSGTYNDYPDLWQRVERCAEILWKNGIRAKSGGQGVAGAELRTAAIVESSPQKPGTAGTVSPAVASQGSSKPTDSPGTQDARKMWERKKITDPNDKRFKCPDIREQPLVDLGKRRVKTRENESSEEEEKEEEEEEEEEEEGEHEDDAQRGRSRRRSDSTSRSPSPASTPVRSRRSRSEASTRAASPTPSEESSPAPKKELPPPLVKYNNRRKEAKEKGEKSGSKDVGKAIRKTAREATKKEKEALGIEPKKRNHVKGLPVTRHQPGRDAAVPAGASIAVKALHSKRKRGEDEEDGVAQKKSATGRYATRKRKLEEVKEASASSISRPDVPAKKLRMIFDHVDFTMFPTKRQS